MPLVLFAGQSNALGFGNTGPAPYTPTWRVQMWTDTNHNGVWDVGDNFNAMVPGVNTGTPNHPTAWGPEVQFANDWLAANPAGILYIGKVAKGSTALAQNDGLDWSPASRGELFDQAATVALHMRANLGVSKLDAVFWMQGEQDATNADWAATYDVNLTSFISEVRSQWMNEPDGYVGLGRITDSVALPFSLDVRVAQWAEDQTDPNLHSFKTIGFDMQEDGLHYSTAGQVALGAAFFDGWAF